MNYGKTDRHGHCLFQAKFTQQIVTARGTMMFCDWEIDPWKNFWDPAGIQSEDCRNTSPMLISFGFKSSDTYSEGLGFKSQLDSQILSVDLILNLSEQRPKPIAMQQSGWVLP